MRNHTSSNAIRISNLNKTIPTGKTIELSQKKICPWFNYNSQLTHRIASIVDTLSFSVEI